MVHLMVEMVVNTMTLVLWRYKYVAFYLLSSFTLAALTLRIIAPFGFIKKIPII